MKKYLIVFLISMVPLIELRGAIPYAVGFDLPLVPSYIVAVIGNMLPVPFIFLFGRRLLEWGKDKPLVGGFFRWCLVKGEKAGNLDMKDQRGNIGKSREKRGKHGMTDIKSVFFHKKSPYSQGEKPRKRRRRMKNIRSFVIFSRPDFTVGAWISHARPSPLGGRFADYTAGTGSHSSRIIIIVIPELPGAPVARPAMSDALSGLLTLIR